ncbi:MAG: hypothetical protein Q7S21_02135 [archaeon]|nr:hypothetical protein [archaeon]
MKEKNRSAERKRKKRVEEKKPERPTIDKNTNYLLEFLKAKQKAIESDLEKIKKFMADPKSNRKYFARYARMQSELQRRLKETIDTLSIVESHAKSGIPVSEKFFETFFKMERSQASLDTTAGMLDYRKIRGSGSFSRIPRTIDFLGHAMPWNWISLTLDRYRREEYLKLVGDKFTAAWQTETQKQRAEGIKRNAAMLGLTRSLTALQQVEQKSLQNKLREKQEQKEIRKTA